MRFLSIAAAAAAAILIAFTLVPASIGFRPALTFAALICAVIVVIAVLAAPRQEAAPVRARPEAAATTPPAPPPSVTQAQPLVDPAHAAVIALLAALQEKGRFIDFVQDDVTAYSDAQVGAAARVVHQGCKAVLAEYFRIEPVRSEAEGAAITIPAGYRSDDYRLVGKIAGSPPFTGTLTHPGWKTEAVKLPRALRADGDRLPNIAPAEVELR